MRALKRLYYKAEYALRYQNGHRNLYEDMGYSYLESKSLQLFMQRAITKQQALCMGKIGGTEGFALAAHDLMSIAKQQEAYAQLCKWSGFFPNVFDKHLYHRWYEEQLHAISQLDIIQDYQKSYEDYLLKKAACGKIYYTKHISAWGEEQPWTASLEGRKVLVIHPFVDTMKSQYTKRELLFPGKKTIPEFQLKTLKAVQTIGNAEDRRFQTWFDALDYMEREALTQEFDIALIGCGAYGLPLAARLKQHGKIAVHMGGDLQMLFGIRGSRWDLAGLTRNLSNEAWIYPSEQEKPAGAEAVENACYW